MMTEATDLVRRVVVQALSGRGAHVLVREVVDGLDWSLAGESREGVPHTVFEIVNHLVYWQEFSLTWIDGDQPPTPEHAADSWPGASGPASEDDWRRAVEAFADGLSRLESCARTVELEADRGEKTVLEILQLIASHNSYHAGQIAMLRRMLGSWPPPGGGATW